MAKKPREIYYVVAVYLPQTGPGGICYDKNGKPSKNEHEWMEFFSFDDAKEWAEELGLEMSDAHNYVANLSRMVNR